MHTSPRLKVLEGEESLFLKVISSRCVRNKYFGLFHWENLWIEGKMFYSLHLLKRGTSAPLGALAPCSFTSSSTRLTFLDVLLTLSSALVVWCASRFGLDDLLLPYNFSDDSLIYRLNPYLSLFFIQMPNGYLYLIIIKKFIRESAQIHTRHLLSTSDYLPLPTFTWYGLLSGLLDFNFVSLIPTVHSIQ